MLHRSASHETFIHLERIFRGNGGRIRKSHAESLDAAGHGVGGVHAAARARARARVTHDVFALFLRDSAGNELSVRLERGYDIECATIHGGVARANGTAVNHQRRAVQSTHGHDRTRHVLIAPRERNISVVPLSTHHGLDAIRDQIPRLQREGHARRTHGNPVRHPHGVKLKAHHIRRLDAFRHFTRQVQQVFVTRVSLPPHRGHADLRFVHIGLRQARGVQHRLRRSLALRLRDLSRPLVQIARVAVGHDDARLVRRRANGAAFTRRGARAGGRARGSDALRGERHVTGE
mmetsp:Transcript_3116/g.11969  ORF Transcript_3116/g.11969 Transcript_3116/m.11969 type:complete len:291 (+) Transcript_3116:2028-2900(+)